ncbi:MAG TPA: hypothetical protein DCY53_09605 [Desulfobacteraceae bacterium]|nr:hypothetical protein [Desulfobacteraceae bacterium]
MSASIDELPPEFLQGHEAVSTSLCKSGKLSTQNITEDLTNPSGNKSRAARLLGISRRTLYRKIHNHKITL